MYTISPVQDKVKHTGAHILAAAITRLRPSAKLGIGPVTKEGFYYDIDLNKPFTEKDFSRIEREVDKIIRENLPMQQIILDRDQAINMLLQKGQVYKAELVKSIPDPEISFYKTGDGFIDLCRGPHAYSTGDVGAVKITRVEDVHWNEDQSRPKMQRIYGVVFNSKNELSDYYKIKEEEQQRNYKSIINIMGLGKAVASDKVILNSKGTAVLNSIYKLIWKHLLPLNHKEVYISSASNLEEASEYITYTFSYKIRSPREYPIIYKSELNLPVSFLREEKEYHNIILIKKFFLGSDELSHTAEIENVIDVLKSLKIDTKANIYNTNPENPVVAVISNLLQKEGISHNKIVYKDENRTLITFKGIDIFNREWDLAEVKFEKEITSADNQKAIAVEYFINPFALMAYILENTKGDIPPIISPTQIVIIPINKNYLEYAHKIQEHLQANTITSEVDFRSISLKRKIYLAEQNKSSVQLVVGEKESATNSVSIRHKNIDQGLVSIEELVNHIETLIEV